MAGLVAIGMGSFLIAFSGAASPGPVLTITLAESAKRGFKVGPLIVLGHAILEVPVVIAVVVGIGTVLQGPVAVRILGVVGGAVLFWLAWQTYRESSVPLQTHQWEENPQGCRDLPLKGILTSLSNPYWFLWWATIGLAYLTIAIKKGWAGVASFYVGHILADLVWYSFISGLVASGRKFLGTRSYAWLLMVCALVLFIFGLYFFYVGAKGRT